jgi:putative zinc finger/helix-turn-helix YgiT family protein
MSVQNTCPTCGNAGMTAKRGHYHFRESGLDNVHLLNVPIMACDKCGEEIISIRLPTQLMKCIAAEGILLKPAPLNGPEIRFLRKNLTLKIGDFAQLLAVDRVTVSRWENSHDSPSKSSDRLIRLVYASQAMVGTEIMEKLNVHLRKEEEDRQLDYVFPLTEHGILCAA